MSWNPWRDAREARLQAQALHAAALASLERVAVAQSEAYQALAQALKDYFDSFKALDEPKRWVNDDYAEWKAEQERLMTEAGMPVGATERDRLAWLRSELDS